MITQRDEEILKFINVFGKSYLPVLSQTFFKNDFLARRRMKKLYDYRMITYRKTNLMKPRKAIFLTEVAKKYLIDLGIEPKESRLNISTIYHNINEQIVYYYLVQIGEVIRTTSYHHSKTLHHVPDFIFINKNGIRTNIEVEMSKKSLPRYKKILHNTFKDDVNAILYVLKTKNEIEKFASFLPKDDRLLFIDIDSLKTNIITNKKINPISQADLLEQRLFKTEIQ